MTRFADPERCPDCASPIVPRAARCQTCGLPLHGQLAQRLFLTLTAADSLLVELRASALPAAETITAPASGTRVTPPAPAAYVDAGPSDAPGATPASLIPTGKKVAPPRPRSGLSAATVPQILLGLGALCVLVAAVVFLAVTWSLMGVGGRTATLVAFTAVSAGLAWWLARRDLRTGAESLAVVSLGLLALDIFGAESAGWLGAPSLEVFLVALGALLALGGLALSLVTRSAPTGPLTGSQVVAGLGVLVAVGGLSDLDQGRTDVDLLATVLIALAITLVLHRIPLGVACNTSGVAATLAWLALLMVGVARVVEHATFAELLPGRHAWPAIAAAAVVGTAVAVRRLPLRFRVAAASTAAAIVTGVVVAPAIVDASATGATLATLAVLIVAAVAAWIAPQPWGLTAALTQLIGAAWVATVGVSLAGVGAERLADVAGGRGSAVDPIPAVAASLPAPWLLPLCVAAVLGSLLTSARAARAPRVVRLVSDRSLAAVLLAASSVLTVAMLAPPVWVPVALLLLAAAGFTTAWSLRPSGVTLVAAASFSVMAVVVAQHAAGLTAIAVTVALVASAFVHLAERQTWVAELAGVTVAVALAGLAWSIGDLGGAPASRTVLVGLLVLAALGTLHHLLPASWWAASSPAEARIGLEVGAAAVAIPLGLLGVLLAPEAAQASWAAGYLTLAGVAVTATALVRPERRLLGWPGGLLLASATWVRLDDLGVREPEAYTLPSALALVSVGLWQLRRSPDASTLTLLTPGLTLAVLPSLIWALAEPSGVRVLLLGVGCLALVVTGVSLRWTAPVLAGALAGGLLVLRLAAPYLDDAVPRWVLIGGAGALLIAVGVTWEQRLHEARRLRQYVAALR